MKLGLIPVTVNPRLGGILVRGEKGTAKSTLLIIISDGKADVSLGQERPFLEACRAAKIIRGEERVKTLVDAEPPGFLG